MSRRSHRYLSTAALAGALLTVGIGVAGCSSSSSGSKDSVPARIDVTVRAIDGIAWDSKAYTAASVNGSVEIEGDNESGLAHNLYVIAADGTEAAGHLDLPNRGTKKFESLQLAPGTYSIICKIPGHSNMKATLTVT
jgi:plastocyanin